MNVRLAEEKDFPRMLEIFAYARQFMAQNNNPTQWGTTNPPADTVKNDILNGRSYVLEDEQGIIHGTFMFSLQGEPTYKVLEGGSWLNEDPYGVIHRVASDGTYKGILEEILAYCEQICPNLRIDTHKDNSVMLHLLEKNGFTRCGVIYLANGSPRFAFQRVS